MIDPAATTESWKERIRWNKQRKLKPDTFYAAPFTLANLLSGFTFHNLFCSHTFVLRNFLMKLKNRSCNLSYHVTLTNLIRAVARDNRQHEQHEKKALELTFPEWLIFFS